MQRPPNLSVQRALLFHIVPLPAFQPHRGIHSQIDAEREVELVAFPLLSAPSEPALIGLGFGSQRVMACKDVVVVGTQVSRADSVVAFPVSHAEGREEVVAIEAHEMSGRVEETGSKAEMVRQHRFASHVEGQA